MSYDSEMEFNWTDERGEEAVNRHLFIAFRVTHEGCRHGHFNPITGDGEGPSGPEIEIDKIEEKHGEEWKPVDQELYDHLNNDDWLYQKMVDQYDGRREDFEGA